MLFVLISEEVISGNAFYINLLKHLSKVQKHDLTCLILILTKMWKNILRYYVDGVWQTCHTVFMISFSNEL